MDDVSDFFKSGFLNLHKHSMGRTYQQKTLKDRMNKFNNVRRETRNTLIFQKRQINENMTPISTPEPTKLVKNAIGKKEAQKPNKRLEMLKKWKADKEKQKQENQKKAKPLFKVYHVPQEMGLPNLENVNKEIKGKPIKSSHTPVTSQFAPPNHKFRAPKNIKPIIISSHNNNTSLRSKSKMESLKTNLTETNKTNKSKQNPVISQRNTRSATSRREQTSKLNEKETILSSKSKIPNGIDKRNPRQNKLLPHKTMSDGNSKIDSASARSKLKESIQKNTSNINTRKKLQLKNTSVVKSDFNKDVNCSSPKKNRNDVRTAKRKAHLVMASAVSEDTSLAKNTRQRTANPVKKQHETNSVPTAKVIKETPKKSKLKFAEVSNFNDVTTKNEKERFSKQPKLKEDTMLSILNKSKKSTDITPKKSVGWNVIEIVESDDEVFSKEINDKTPKRTYKKTPRKEQKTKTLDNIRDESLTNELNEQRNVSLTSKNYKNGNKTPIQNISLKYSEESAEKIIRNTSVESRNSTIESATGSASPDYPIECIYSTDKNLNISSHTPVKSICRVSSPVYISPFVTVSRGKSSARKEYQVRQSSGGNITNTTPEFVKDISNNISPTAGADYFTKKLNNEITRIESICDEWNIQKNHNNFPEEANDMIDVAIGQSKLLISKKFQQFRSLIDQCKNCEYKEKPITCEDLHGFWDMIYMQVEDVNKRFNALDVLKANDWQEVVPEKKPVVKRGRGRPKKAAASSVLKNLIKTVRNKKESNANNGQNLTIPQSDVTVFTSGYSIKSPIKEEKSPIQRPSSVRKSLRVSLLAGQTRGRRISSSPGLTMMKISQAIKSGDGLTPSKSILKSDITKSANKVAKSVIFKDDLEDIREPCKSSKMVLFKNVDNVNKENDCNEMNLINFSPITPTRRSRRLSKMN